VSRKDDVAKALEDYSAAVKESERAQLKFDEAYRTACLYEWERNLAGEKRQKAWLRLEELLDKEDSDEDA
jgi:hypothetical protein